LTETGEEKLLYQSAKIRKELSLKYAREKAGLVFGNRFTEAKLYRHLFTTIF